MCFHVVPCMFIKRQLPLVSPTKALIASANNVYITSDVVVRVIYLSSAVMKTLTVIIRSCRRPCVCVCALVERREKSGRIPAVALRFIGSHFVARWMVFAVINAPVASVRRAMQPRSVMLSCCFHPVITSVSVS